MEKSKEFVKNKTQGLIIKDAVRKVLEDVDMKKDLKGFQLWTEAITYVVAEKIKCELYAMKDVYNVLAIKHNVSYSQVERALRTAVLSTSIDVQTYFNTKHKITNSLFLALACAKVEKIAKI
ncbi:MAG: hypothetical protein HFJ52_04195 [Clostridia bacterium]|jgi:hypothetical protein|nr:hypothetical protein [Clostridia bacterium]